MTFCGSENNGLLNLAAFKKLMRILGRKCFRYSFYDDLLCWVLNRRRKHTYKKDKEALRVEISKVLQDFQRLSKIPQQICQ
jgi:hypothetical protein